MEWKCGRCGDRGPEHNAIRCPGCGLDQWERVQFIVTSVADTEPTSPDPSRPVPQRA